MILQHNNINYIREIEVVVMKYIDVAIVLLMIVGAISFAFSFAYHIPEAKTLAIISIGATFLLGGLSDAMDRLDKRRDNKKNGNE